ncbi:uncharacterized protein LOC117111619 [Anneissia japonica]|uniref:uncharacterized protein LOC117111619 n=1 Tax=Anneissia japonica TaxID=1529436 RepID=UPI00142577E4|nr:uncharacterized protein LOC117111619 [Anneissia japonica]
MKVSLVLGFVCVTLFLQIRFCSAARKGSGSSPPGRPRPRPSSISNRRPNVDLGVCQAQGRGIRTLQNKIIRTKDSIDNGACFANAIVVGSIDECSARCCSFSGDDCDGKCDTSIFVHETDDDNSEDVNCFLFVCGDGQDCKFSYHSGYTTTMILRHQERTEPPSTTVSVKKTTTAPIIHTTHSARSTTTATWDLPTTTKQEIHRLSPSPSQVLPIDENYEEKEDENSYNHNSHDCGRYRFKCGSGECFKFSYICNGIIDCRDNSDETGCDYTSTVAPLISTAPAHDSQVWPTRLYPASTKARSQQVPDMRTNSASAGQTFSMAGFSSPEAALGSKKDFLSKHVVAEESREDRERVASGRLSDNQIGYRVHPADGGLTQELHSKGQERMNEPDEIQGGDLSLTDLQDDLNALSATGSNKGGNPDDHDNENKYTGRKGGTSNLKIEDQNRSGEYTNDRNEDYDSNGGEMWVYNDDGDKESQQLDQDFYGTKFEEDHDENRKDEDSLKEIGREKEEKNMLDLDYDTYDTSGVVDTGKHNGYGRLPNDGYKKEGVPDSTRENLNSMQHEKQDDPMSSRPVYEAVGRKLDNVQHLPHTRKNDHQTQFKNAKIEMNHQMKSPDHTVNGRLESTQRSDKGAHAELSPPIWQGRRKGGWDDRSFTSESSDADDTHDTDKGLIRDKGDRWLQQGPKTGEKEGGTYGAEYFNRDHDSGWPDKHVVSRNRNLGWPENIHEERQRNKMKDGHVLPNRLKTTSEAEYEPDLDITSQKFVSKWQDRQRRPDLPPNQVYLPKYNRQKEPNWYNNPDRKQEYRDYEDLGRGENAHQFWNQYKNQQIQHHRPNGNNAGSSQDYSANEYDTADSIDEDMNDITTTEPPNHDHQFVGMSSIIPTTTTKSNRNTSENAITKSSGNITEATKKTFPNNSNKHGSLRKHLFKTKSPLTDKPLTSAILPLAFGLLITVLLLLLVGCRLRQVNRRLHYGRVHFMYFILTVSCDLNSSNTLFSSTLFWFS